MPSTVEQLSPSRAKLTVEIPFSDLQPHLTKAYREIAQSVTIPGFRKGKVPSAVIDQRFGRGVVLQEAINAALPSAYEQAVRETEIVPLGQPDIDGALDKLARITRPGATALVIDSNDAVRFFHPPLPEVMVYCPVGSAENR